MPPTKSLGFKYREAYESNADSLPKKKKKKKSNITNDDSSSVGSGGSSGSGFSSSIGSDDNNEYDYSYRGSPKFEATAKDRAMKRHVALEKQESKLSQGARKNLLKRRLMEERRNLRQEYAIKIQSFVRGGICRHRVGLMVAELIDQLQASSSQLPFDEPYDDDDMSIDEAIYKQYLTELAATEEDGDESEDGSLRTNESGEVIDGLKFPSSLHEINLDDLSVSSDGSDGGSFGGDDEEEVSAASPFYQREQQQQQEPNVPSVASRIGKFNAKQQKMPESPFTFTKQKASVKGIHFTSGSPLVKEKKQPHAATRETTNKIAMPDWLSTSPAEARAGKEEVAAPAKIGSGSGGVMAAASIFEKKQQPLPPPLLPKEQVSAKKAWKPAPAKEPSEAPSTPLASAKASINFGASVNTFLSPSKFVTDTDPTPTAVAVISPKPSKVKPSSIADRVKRFNIKHEEREDHELAAQLSPRPASPRKMSSSRSGGNLDQLRNKFVVPTEKKEEPKSKKGKSSRPSLTKKENSIRDLAAKFDRPEKESSSNAKEGRKKDGTTKESDKRTKQKDVDVIAPVEDSARKSEINSDHSPSSDDTHKSNDEIVDKASSKNSISVGSVRANFEGTTSSSNQSLQESNEIQTSATPVESNAVAAARSKFDAAVQITKTTTEVRSNRPAGGESTTSPTVENKEDRSDQRDEEPETDKTSATVPAETKEITKDASVFVDYDDIDDEATAPETVDDNTATEEDDDGMVEELFLHFSATQIQALARGYLFRKNNENDNSDDETEERRNSSHAKDSLQSLSGMGPSLAERQRAFMKKTDTEKADTGENHRPSMQSSKKFKARQEKRKNAAIKIQALGRGFLIRKVDYATMLTVINWLENYKPRKDESDPVDEQFAEAVSEWVENVAQGVANMKELPKELSTGAKKFAVQKEQQASAATKIQALARGYIHRKFDAKSVMATLEWLEDIHEEDTPPEPPEPKVKKLEEAWAFLEENNTPPKKPKPQICTKSDEQQQQPESSTVENPPRRTNVKELLGTWEWLKKADNRVKKAPKRAQPSEASTDSIRESTNSREKSADSTQSTQTSRPKISELIQFYSWLEDQGLESGISGVADESYESIRNQARNDIPGGAASRGAPGMLQSPFLSGGAESNAGKDSVSNKLRIDSHQKGDSNQLGGTNGSKSGSKTTKFNSLISLWGWLERNDMDMDIFRSTERDAGDEYLEEDMLCAMRRTVDPQSSGDGVQYLEEDGPKAYGAQKWKKPVQPEQRSGHSRRYDEPRKGDGVQYLDEDSGALEENHEEGPKAYSGPRWKKPEQPVHRSGESRRYEESLTSDGVRYLDDEDSGALDGGKNADGAKAYSGPRWKKPEKPTGGFSDRTYEEERTGDGVQYLDDEDDGSDAYGGPRWKKPEQPGGKYSDRRYEEQPTGDGVQYLDDEDDGSDAYGGPRWKKPEQPGAKYGDRRYEEQPTSDGVQYLDDEDDGSDAYGGPRWKKPEQLGDKYSNRTYEEQPTGDGVQYLDDEYGSDTYGGPRWKKPEQRGNKYSNRTYDEQTTGDGVRYLDDGDGSDAYGGPRWKKPEKPGDRFSDRTYEEKRKGDGVQYLDDEGGLNAHGGPRWKKPEKPGDRFSDRVYEEERKGDGVQYIDEKPTMEAMVNYWNFSAIHADKHDLDDEDNQIGNDGDEKNSASVEKAGEPALAKWVEEPLKNDLLNTLSWMDTQGVDLDEVKADDVVGDSDTLSEALPEKDDMLDMLNWLNKRGLDKASGKLSETREDLEHNAHVSESTGVSDASTLPSKSGTPNPSDMENALRWLQRRGFSPRSSSKETNSSQSNDGDIVDALDSKDVIYELSWLKKHGFDLDTATKHDSTTTEKHNDTKNDDRSSVPSATEMMDALSFLGKRSPKSPSKKKKSSAAVDQKIDDPSEETAAAIEWLQERGVGSDKHVSTSVNKKKKTSKKGSKNDQETKNSSRSKPKLSSSEMENALSWLTKKGFSGTNKPKQSAMPSSQNMEAAIRLAKSKPPSAVKKGRNRSKRPSVEDMEKALAFVKMHDNPKPQSKKQDEKPDNNNDDMPSWKKKLLGAKKKIFEQDGEKRPDWLQKRVDIVNKKTYPLLSTRPPPPPIQHSPKESVPKGKTKATTELFESSEKKKKKKSQRQDSSKQSHSKKGVKNSSPLNKKSKKVEKSKKETEKKDITKTLNWLTSKASNPMMSPKKNSKQSVQSLMSPKGNASPGTRSKRSKKPRNDMTQAELDFENALNWLTTKRADSVEDFKYFKKLDAILPKRADQSVESRAKQMAKAMKWVKKQEGQKAVEKLDVPKPSGLSLQDQLSSSHRSTNSHKSAQSQLSQSNRESTSGASSKDERRNRKKRSETIATIKKESDDTAVVKSKPAFTDDDKLPTPKDQDPVRDSKKEYDDTAVVESEPVINVEEKLPITLEDPAKNSKMKHRDTTVVESKQESIDEDKPVKESKKEHDDPAVVKSIPEHTKERKSTKPKSQDPANDSKNLSQDEIDLNNAIAWLADKQNDSLQDAKYFKKLDSMLPLKPGQTSDERAKDMAKALRWVKKSSAKQSSANQEKGKEEPLKNSTKPPTQSEIDMKNALAWVSNKRNSSLEDAKYFKKLDSMLPEKPGQSDEQRAKDLVKALHWVKKTSGKQEGERKLSGTSGPKVEEQTIKNANKISRTVVSASILQDRDTANALKWLSKQGGDVSVSDAASFKKLDEKLPVKKGQSREDRAVEMAKALKLMRKRGVDSAKKNSTGPETSTKEQSPKTESTPTQQIENATKFLTASSEGNDASQIADAAYFRKLDNMLPKKPNQTTEARAQEMVKMLGWMKKKGKM